MKRLTITVPDDVAARLDEVDNVSAFITSALRAQDRKLRTDAMLRSAQGGDVDPQERARVRAKLRRQLAELDAKKADRQLDQARRAKETADARLAALVAESKRAA